MSYIVYIQCLHDNCSLQQWVSIVTSTWCVCVQWLFLKLCGTQWTGSNQELASDADKFIKSKGNLLFYISVLC